MPGPEYPEVVDVPGQAVRVADGDTIEVSVNGDRIMIGLNGVKVPQGNTPCGREATARLQELVGEGIRLEHDPGLDFDQKSRKLYRAVTKDGRGVAEEMIAVGTAAAEPEGKAAASVKGAEDAAKQARRGCVWARSDGVRPATELKQPTPAAPEPGRNAAARPGKAPVTNVPAPGQPAARPGQPAGSPQQPAARDEPRQGGQKPKGGGDEPGTAAPAGEAAPDLAEARLAAAGLPQDFDQETLVNLGNIAPTSFAWLPDGRMLVTEKRGVVRVVKNGQLLPTPLIDLSGQVNDFHDHGLISVAVDPNFATNGFVYLAHTYENDRANYDGPKTSRVVRVTANGDTAAPSSLAVILGKVVGRSCNDFAPGADCLPSDEPSHSIGDLRFGPDGSLFVSIGDGASFNFVDDKALRVQDLRSTAGKILRVTPSGAGLASNPFWNGSAAANQSKVWALGVRNAYRFSLRPGTDVPYLGDVQWNTTEEVNAATRGSNLGWPCFEGTDRLGGYDQYPECQALYNRGDARAPLHAYPHDGGGAAATGGVFSVGTRYPEAYRNRFFYGDYARGFIRTIGADANHNKINEGPFGDGIGGPVDFERGPDGDIAFLDIYTGQIRAIRYRGATAPPPAVTCAAGQFTAEYFANPALSGTPLVRRCEATINNDWGAGGPGGGVPVDNFSARWVGRPTFAAGAHTFTATADDGVRVFVDEALVIDGWKDQPATTYTANRTLTAGAHEVRVEYYEAGNDAVAQVGWRAGTASQPPVPKITSPAATTKYKVGDIITYSGSATDPEDGAVPAANLTWQVVIKHCPGGTCHDHVLKTSTGATGTFTVPDHGDDSWFDVVLTATDSGGQKAATTTTIKPQEVQLTLATSPPGLEVIYGDQRLRGPSTRLTPVGSVHTLSAPSPQVLNGKTYRFSGWSDRGAQQHNITATATPATYTATFTADGTAPPPPPAPTSGCQVGQWMADYFNNVSFAGAPALRRCESAIDKPWGEGGPPGIGPDNFTARWTGRHNFTAGYHTFTATADDGVRVFVDGVQIIGGWQDQPPTTYKATRYLTAGTHEVRVEYFERYGGAVAKVGWT